MTIRRREENEEEASHLLDRTPYYRSDSDSQNKVLQTDIDEKPTAAHTPPQIEATWRILPHKKQLLLLSLCRLSTPLSNACILPYLYNLARSTLTDPNDPSAPQKISQITGLLVAAYPVGQMMTSMLLGRMSDTYGRKPAILLGLAVSVIANLAFGFSTSLGFLLFWRIVAGMANGIVGVMRTMTAEIVKDRKHQTRAFLAPPLVFNSGRVVALAVGGCLADPVHNLPGLFGPRGVFTMAQNPDGVAWMSKYPYALPTVFNSIVLAVCFMLAAIWLRESIAEKEKEFILGITFKKMILDFMMRNLWRRKNHGYTPLQDEEPECLTASSTQPTTSQFRSSIATSQAHEEVPETTPTIWTRKLIRTLIAFGLQPLHNSTFLHIFPVFLSMPAASHQNPNLIHFTGGLDLSTPTIGILLASFGIIGIATQLFTYPRLQSRIGTLGVLRLGNAVTLLAYICAPYLSLLADKPHEKWFAVSAVLLAQVMARTMLIPSTVLLLTDAAPSKKVLGRVHGAGNTVSAMASAVGPVVGGALLAAGIERGVVGVVWWAWMGVVALSALWWSLWLGLERNRGGDCEV